MPRWVSALQGRGFIALGACGDAPLKLGRGAGLVPCSMPKQIPVALSGCDSWQSRAAPQAAPILSAEAVTIPTQSTYAATLRARVQVESEQRAD